MTETLTLKIGDRLKDNDPRMPVPRFLEVVAVLPNGVLAISKAGKKVSILRRRIYTDGKPRRNGFDLVVKEQA